MHTRPPQIEEHELPAVEAVLAGTLALMTGYSQALQAALQPEHRVMMGAKIGRNLALLLDHPELSPPFRQVLCGLRQRWLMMSACTEEAQPAARSGGTRSASAPAPHTCLAPPSRLQ